jgi:cobalt-zinc-cadmium efflux system protein
MDSRRAESTIAIVAGHTHARSDHHHHHPHEHRHAHGSGGALRAAAALTIGFAIIEGLGGWWTGSLALLSDAGHMLTDGSALALGALAAWIARRPPSSSHSYGLGRAEIFAATINAAAMLIIAAIIAYEAAIRFGRPVEIKGGWAALVALGGLAINLAVMRWLAPHVHDLNARAARLHVIADALGSIAALTSGVVVALTGWTPIDPLASLLIGFLVAWSGLRLLREGVHALMEGVPASVSVEAVGTELASAAGVVSVHDLHVWTLSGSRTALSAHVVIESMGQWERVLPDLQQRLHERFGIDHVTLQPETQQRPLVRFK